MTKIYPTYVPKNKDAKKHLRQIQQLGYRAFTDLPITFDYYEPSLANETKGAKASRRQTECKHMKD